MIDKIRNARERLNRKMRGLHVSLRVIDMHLQELNWLEKTEAYLEEEKWSSSDRVNIENRRKKLIRDLGKDGVWDTDKKKEVTT